MGLSPAAILYDADGHPVAVTLDGSIYKLEAFSKLRNSSGTVVNPATEDTLALIKSTDGIKKIVDALPAGDNNIGNVDLASSIPAGTNNIGDVDIASALPAGDNNIGNVDIASALPAGDNNIGNVDLASSIPAGTNNIGDVDLASSIPAGTNEIGKVAQGTRAAASAGWPEYIVDSTGNVVGVVLDGSAYRLQTQAKIVRASDGSQINPATEETLALIKNTDGIKKIVDQLPAGTNNIGDVDLASSIPAGTNNIGDVDLASAIPAGTNEIGKVAQGTKAANAAAWPQYLVDSSGNIVGVVLDGAVYRLRTEAKIVRASDGAQINPATQETLALIKDTDGIKKITDQLPTGTNEIGKVAQGTKAAGSAAWPQVLYDASGNAVGVVLDGAVYRIQSDAKIAKGASALVHLEVIDTTSGMGRMKSTLYTPDGDPVTFGSVPPNPESIVNSFAKNGTSESLLVNGSVTSVVFSYNADSAHDISLQEIQLVMSANSITFGTSNFGAVSGPLTNGLLVEIISEGNTGTLGNLVQNESFVHWASPGGFQWVVSSKDMMSASYSLGGGLRLKAGTADKVRVTVRDNLTSAASYFRCYVKGNLLEPT